LGLMIWGLIDSLRDWIKERAERRGTIELDSLPH